MSEYRTVEQASNVKVARTQWILSPSPFGVVECCYCQNDTVVEEGTDRIPRLVRHEDNDQRICAGTFGCVGEGFPPSPSPPSEMEMLIRQLILENVYWIGSDSGVCVLGGVAEAAAAIEPLTRGPQA